MHFEPGPVGLKLEPVVESMGRQVGCRVLEFADEGENNPGQARKSGKIRPGDLLLAIDARDVISWNYPDIIALLRRNPGAVGRDMVFRSVWSPVSEMAGKAVEQTVPATVVEAREVATPVRKPRLMDDTSPDEFPLSQSPAEVILHSHFLSSFPDAENVPLRRYGEGDDDVASELTSVAERDCEESVVSQCSASQSVATHSDEGSCFSPSSVKKLAASGVANQSPGTLPSPRAKSNIIKTVYRSVAPTAGVVVSSSYSLTSHLTSAMSTKLGEALVGHKSKDFDHAVQLKMQLLSELSQAKVTLDQHVEEHRRLEQLSEQLTAERDSERQAREDAEKALTSSQEEKVCRGATNVLFILMCL